MDLCDQRQIKALLTRHGFHFSKRLGQNFLIAPWVPQETAAASGAAKGIGVLEIGPGIGPLTQELSLRAEKVAAVELDRSLLPVLAETMAGRENVTIIPGDILKLDLETLCREEFPGLPVVVCANLPYNITTPVLTALLESRCFQSVTVMIQREVALRICAQPGTADYGAFTLLCQYYADGELLYDVPPDCFYPAPKVTSSVLRLMTREAPPAAVPDPALFFRLVRGAFGQRRKTLLNALAADFGARLDKEALRQAILACDLTETIRGERLSFESFAELSRKVGEILESEQKPLA
ncbi:MAG: ribosomal RNA small subunit methyltransferase A [Ruminiclostridium sp.]|nr:ribosomal RNA small subunit methyltransferase A [Ruminiclostridium sp.]